MERWDGIKTNETGLKQLLIYLDSPFNSESDGSRACDIEKLEYDQTTGRYVLSLRQRVSGDRFVSRMEEALQRISLNPVFLQT